MKAGGRRGRRGLFFLFPGGGGFSAPVYQARDAVTQMDDIEVEEQSYRLATEGEVREELRFVKLQNLFYRFEFHHYELFYDQVGTISARDRQSVVPDRQPD